MRAQLLHLSGPHRGRTETYAAPVVGIGSGPGATVRLPGAGVAPVHAEIAWHEPSCSFLLRSRGGPTFVNGQQVEEVILQPDDLLEFGVDGPRARFRIHVPPGRVCKPVRRMLRDARDVRRESGHVAGARSLAADLFTRATPQLKVGFPLAVLLVALPLAWLAGWLGGSRSVQRRVTADAITQAEIQRLRQGMAEQRREIQRLVASRDVLGRIQRDYSASVCLIHGVFGYRDAAGAWWTGPGNTPLEVEYTGTGFVAGPRGQIVTNRHVAEPWRTMRESDAMRGLGYQPVFRRLTATFPGRAPVPVAREGMALRTDDIDVAVVRAEAAADLPALPLHGGDPGDLQDRRAIVVGYPTGLGALLAKADEALVATLRARRASMTEVIDELAQAGAIEPILTEGVLGNVQPTKLVYDASTTHGGSGGPVFGSDGTVIGVNYAILPGFTGVNFGVPIRFAQELLKP